MFLSDKGIERSKRQKRKLNKIQARNKNFFFRMGVI